MAGRVELRVIVVRILTVRIFWNFSLNTLHLLLNFMSSLSVGCVCGGLAIDILIAHLKGEIGKYAVLLILLQYY